MHVAQFFYSFIVSCLFATSILLLVFVTVSVVGTCSCCAPIVGRRRHGMAWLAGGLCRGEKRRRLPAYGTGGPAVVCVHVRHLIRCITRYLSFSTGTLAAYLPAPGRFGRYVLVALLCFVAASCRPKKAESLQSPTVRRHSFPHLTSPPLPSPPRKRVGFTGFFGPEPWLASVVWAPRALHQSVVLC